MVPSRLLADLAMLMVSMMALAMYYIDSKSPAWAPLDWMSSVGLVFEKAVTYGTPLVIAGAMLARWQDHGYE